MRTVEGPTTVVEAVAQALRDDLLDGALTPGQVLRDTALAEQFGVARPTVRAAIQVLVADGLVKRDRGRSARVPDVSLADVADLYTARAAVELAAVDLIERRAAPVHRVALAVERLRGLGPSAPWRHVVEADVAFHEALVASAGSPRLLTLFHVLADETRLVIALQRALYEAVGDLVDEHGRILVALQAGHFDACRGLLREHFDHTVALLSRQLPAGDDERSDIP